MKLFKEFLGEATQPEWRVSFKKQKMNGVAIDEKPVTVKARDSREAIVKAAEKVGVSDKSAAMQLKTKSVNKLDEAMTEAKYELENAGLNLIEQTQVNEAVSIDKVFMKLSRMLSDVKNTFRDVAREVKADTGMPVRQYQSMVDKIEDKIESLRKDLDKAQTELKKL